MSDTGLELDAETLLKSGKGNADTLSQIPALYSIALSLKRIADSMEARRKWDERKGYKS